jgi:tRNA-(ms[2]io[6]A)-hydroxylase
VLNLASSTDPSWVERALAELDEVLIDHAHCEKKAASTAVSLLFRYPERAELLHPLTRLAREELLHFEMLLDLLAGRGVELCRQPPSPYASELMKAVRQGEPARAIDTLLSLSLIEARSCERMKLLGGATEDPAVRELYAELLASEARHHQSYMDLAALVDPSVDVRRRLAELARHEACVLAAVPPMPRIHG